MALSLLVIAYVLHLLSEESRVAKIRKQQPT